ncbi:histidine kinase dimerization/phospho-acceptor domain-containing protein [Variovorax sp. J22P271]|nr:histidine kinase dimerization/phospho-acceptor domain-containing protein [Variovorax sp. J22P271]MDM0036075.1 histidine kinase dimerization/phospho-acceptor domain-containing protein [Variovorax sp. J22P271]
MKRILRPTIVQRVFLALVMAFVLVWVALLAYIYIEFRQALAVDQGLKRVGRALSAALADLEDDAEAGLLIRATATEYSMLRLSGNPDGSLLLQLQRRDGPTLYASPKLGGQVLSGLPGQVVDQQINGRTHWVFRSDAAHWTLHLAEPEITGQWVLQRNASRVLPYLLLAFPIVLLPIWFAVKLGLRPLRQLAERIAERGPTDLSPIGLDARYEELKPLVAALERMLQQLRDQVAHERAFVHDAAHELRTPMAVIAAQAHALTGARNGEDRARAQSQLELAIARASHLTQQLLELAALDAANARPAQRPVDAAQLVQQLLAQAAPLALARDIELSFDAPDTLPMHLDVPAFQSILENLLDNAIAMRMTAAASRSRWPSTLPARCGCRSKTTGQASPRRSASRSSSASIAAAGTRRPARASAWRSSGRRCCATAAAWCWARASAGVGPAFTSRCRWPAAEAPPTGSLDGRRPPDSARRPSMPPALRTA